MKLFSPQTPVPHHYRPEIDGLRAVAVLLVMLFHAGFSSFKGGYIGVDVFFVISGYLITSIIVREKSEGKFSIARFYERRIRRIFPALFFVIFCMVPFAWFYLLPSEMKSFSNCLISVVFFISNMYFLETSDYFARTSEELPLLHTWSLGVEEQYYVFFPLLLMLVWRFGLKKIMIGFAIFILLSLPVNEILGRSDQEANFFLMPTRAWELIVGALVALAFYAKNNIALPAKFSALPGLIGLALIIAPAFTYHEEIVFPGLAALPPVLGTALILAFARAGTPAARLLSLRPLVGLGLVSYSTYLWHQPVFVFTRFSSLESLADGFYLGLIIISFMLAALTWRYVEQPFRRPGNFSRLAIFTMAAGVSFLVVAIAGVTLLYKGVPARFPAYSLSLVEQGDYDEAREYIKRVHEKIEKNTFADDAGKKILIIGDSFSQDFTNMAYESGYFENYQVSAFYIPARCGLYMGTQDPYQFIEEKDHQLCRKQDGIEQVRDRIEQADIVIIASSWRDWTAERLPETIKTLDLRSSQKLFIIGRKSFKKANIHKYARSPVFTRRDVKSKIPEEYIEINNTMRNAVPRENFIDMHLAFCGQENICPVFTPEGDLISHDGSHLTKAGALYVGKILFENTPLSFLAKK
jgi:peptidoglycan/LPS O-acetylase OafA/YrhL